MQAARCVGAGGRSGARRRSTRASAKFVEKGKLTAADRDAALGRLHRRAVARRPRRASTTSSRRSSRTLDAKRDVLRAARRDHAAGRHPRHQHVVDLDHAARRGDQAARQGARHALHESGAADDAGRAGPRPGDVGRDDADRDRPLQGARQDAGRSRRLPRLHRQPHPDADDQRGDLRGDGRRRHARGDRHGDEARHEPPDGPADARRLHRPRRLPRHHERAARRPRRSEVPAVSAAQAHGRGRTARAEERQGLLHY